MDVHTSCEPNSGWRVVVPLIVRFLPAWLGRAPRIQSNLPALGADHQESGRSYPVRGALKALIESSNITAGVNSDNPATSSRVHFLQVAVGSRGGRNQLGRRE